jgi:hypothetical protein
VTLRSLAAAPVLAVLLALWAPTAVAKDGVVARVLTPISHDAQPGSRVTIAWTLTYPEAGKRRPFGAGYVFARLVGPAGSRAPLAYGVHTRRPGGYRARVKVPRGGVKRLEIGMMGTVCDGDGCRTGPKLFPIRGRVFR